MLPSRWLSFLREHSLSDNRSELVLLREMSEVARSCCRGQAEPVDWRNLARHQMLQVRGAYRYLRELEGALPPEHPARVNCRTLRDLLLAIRGSLGEVKDLLPARKLFPIEKEIDSQRKAFFALGKGVARLDEALESVHCTACATWHAAAVVRCPQCSAGLQRCALSRDDRPDDQAMASDYVRLRQLADLVHTNADDGQPLRDHALGLADLLQATLVPTRKLSETNPEAPVEEMVDYLRIARAALLEMADWPDHRDPKRLERGWLMLRDQLGRFEQALEDHDC